MSTNNTNGQLKMTREDSSVQQFISENEEICPVDGAFEMVKYLVEKAKSFCESSDRLDIVQELHVSLKSFNKTMYELTPQEREILAVLIVTTPGVVRSFLKLADTMFSEIVIHESYQHCFWELNQVFLTWSTTTPLMQQMLVEEGLLSGMIYELELFKDSPNSEDLMYLTVTALSILCNCLQVPANVSYCMNTKCSDIVQCFTNCSDPQVCVFAIFVLSYMEKKLTVEQRHHLKLQSHEVTFIIASLLSSISGERTFLSAIPLLKAIQMTINAERENAHQFLTQGILSTASHALATGDSDLQREMILMLWIMGSATPACMERIRGHFELFHAMKNLQSSCDHDLALLSMCVVQDITKDSLCSAFAGGCYQFHMYEKCITICTEMLDRSNTISSSDFQTVNLLKGKSLFHICNKGIDELPIVLSPEDVSVRQKLNKCIEQAVEAVNLLGFALDNCFIDEEGRIYLDLCMMFLISSANVLKKCERCLLCLANLKIHKERHKGESPGTKETVSQHSKRHRGLHHSHVWPKAVLDAFSSGLIKTSSRRLFRLCGTEKDITQLKSPKEMTWFMLCTDCEQLIGTFEEQFVRNFFKKVYDTATPSMPLESQEIAYGSWLYRFCISMFVRGISLLDLPCNDSLKRFRNSYKLYELFTQCRKILLTPPTAKQSFSDFPSVHLLINPTSPTLEESQLYSTIHEILVSPAFLGLAARKHSKTYFQSPADATLFVAHIGILNVIVDVESVMSSLTHSIDPEGGVYIVPCESERNQFIPPDVKEVIYTSAEQVEIHSTTMPQKLRDCHWTKGLIKSPQTDYEQTFMVHPAQKKDTINLKQQGVKPSQDPNKTKVMNFLPRGFKIERNFGSVELPPGHLLLFHCEHVRSRYKDANCFDRGITLFLAIGDGSKKYPADQPYVIYHKYDPGMYFNMAVFVSKDDLSVLNVVTDDKPQPTAQRLCEDSHFRENIRFTLKTAMYHTGYSSLKSLLPIIKEKRVDLKCMTRYRCWYCINRCDNCMEPAAVGLTKQVENGVIMKFCSEDCKVSINSSPKSLNLLPSPFKLSIKDGKVNVLLPSGHTILQRVNDYYDECGEELAACQTTYICIGNGTDEFPKDKTYIIYKLSTALRQTLAAFFVSDDLTLSLLTIPPEKCDTEVGKSLMASIQKTVEPVLKDVASEAGFSSFPAWCSAAIQGEERYFASFPYYKRF